MKDNEKKFLPLINALRSRQIADEYSALNDLAPWVNIRRCRINNPYMPRFEMLEHLCIKAGISIEESYIRST